MANKITRGLVVSIGLGLTLTCCGGRNNNQLTSSPQTAPPNQFIYSVPVTNGTAGFSIEPKTGNLAALQGSPFPLSLPTGLDTISAFLDLSVDPNNTFLFVRGQTFITHTIVGSILEAYPLDPSTGVVRATPVRFSVGTPTRVVFHPSGKFLYFNDAQSGLIAELHPPFYGGVIAWKFPSSGSDFTQVQGSPFGNHVTDIVIDPAGQRLYANLDVSMSPAGTPSQEIYSIDQNTGALSLISSSVQNSGPITFHPSGKFAYVRRFTTAADQSSTSTTLALYSVDAGTGALTFVSNQSEVSSVFMASPPVFDPSGKFLYTCLAASFAQRCSLAGFAVNGTTGTLSRIPGFATDIFPTSGPVFDKGGQHAYVSIKVNGTQFLFAFSVDPLTGNWSLVPNSMIQGGALIAVSH
jgi:hypothetical protein